MTQETILLLKNFAGERCDYHLKIERCLKRHKLEFFSKILVEIVYLRSTVEKGFNFAIQKFCRWKMWRKKGALSDTIWIFFVNFRWNCLAEISCWHRKLFCNKKFLQVKDVTITWRKKGVLNDTIWKFFCQFQLKLFSWD